VSVNAMFEEARGVRTAVRILPPSKVALASVREEEEGRDEHTIVDKPEDPQ